MSKEVEHMGCCPVCQKALGTVKTGLTHIYECTRCHNSFLGAIWPGICPMCRAKAADLKFIRRLGDTEPIPTEMCPDCQAAYAARREELAQAVRGGGVEFLCMDCGTSGVFAATTDFAKRVREETNKPAPEAVNVTIRGCPRCQKPENPQDPPP